MIGPNSVGMINPTDRVKLGAIGGDNVERCFVPGPVGVISRSGGMTAEVSWMVKRAGYGVSTSVSIGGDALIGSTIKDLLPLFEADPETRAVVIFSEPGTSQEEEAADFISPGGIHQASDCLHCGAVYRRYAGRHRLRACGLDNFGKLWQAITQGGLSQEGRRLCAREF